MPYEKDLDPADKAETALSNLSKNINSLFGRRYEVISFRWLGAGEI